MSLAALVLVLTAAVQGQWVNQPVTALDLHRYAGNWHEIAHLPLFFERHCKSDITATYQLRTDGTVDVENACRTSNGQMDVSKGVARPGASAGALQVRFAPGWLGWVPGVWADYWVIDVDPDYRWAVVGSPSKKYLWILSRTPTLSSALVEQLKERAAQRGYPIDKLVMAPPTP